MSNWQQYNHSLKARTNLTSLPKKVQRLGQLEDLRARVIVLGSLEGKYAEKHAKYANKEYVRKWDFLPNGMIVPLTNRKAIELLEQEALGEFQREGNTN